MLYSCNVLYTNKPEEEEKRTQKNMHQMWGLGQMAAE